MHLASHPEPWGIRTKKVSFDFARVMARKNALIKDFADYRHEQLTSGKFKFLRHMASFVGANTLKLHGAGNLTARYFIIATGSLVAPSPLPALDRVGYLDSDSALTLEKLPDSLIVLGGGAVAVEFAQFFARFGVRVTLIQRSPHVLHEFDEDTTSELENVFCREGVVVYTGTHLLDARKVGSAKRVVFTHNGKTIRVQAAELLFGLGRVPNVASLGLDKIGIKLDGRRILTNHKMETSVPHIYAAGDSTGLHEIVHIAIQQAEIAAHNAAHPEQPREMDYRLLSEVIFTEPQIATVGLTEKRARSRSIPYLAASYRFGDHGKSLIMEQKDGLVKLLASPKSGEILGAACAGPSGGELIHEIIAAMYKRMTVQELAAMPHYHPTLAEIWTYPAEELAEKIVRKPRPTRQKVRR
jgi:pyruvate/2-oxoglutarate dehydrogenase complex dihydrolipoamide dehydrogenase (E3) component